VTAARTIVVVGASLAGATAAATLRQEGFDGRLVLLGDEDLSPYERPGLSKSYLRGEEAVDELFVRDPDWWEAHGVEARVGERVHRVEAGEHAVALTDGQRITFDMALVATGVRNRRLDVPGVDLPGVHQLRTVGDADRIRRAASSAGHAVIVGMGFIGAEVAASLRHLGLEVTVVEVFRTALYRVLGAELGGVLEAIHRDEGVRFRFGDTVERFEGTERVERVVTKGGATIDCDLVVVGVGTEPNAEVLHGEGVASNGGIAVGPTLETSVPGVFAAGDVARHEHPIFGPIRVEHFDNAIKMGEHAARNLLGAGAVFDDPHWFWSDQYDHHLQMGGFVPRIDQTRMVVRGSIGERSFCAFLLDEEGVLRGSVSLDHPRDVRRSLKLIRTQVAPPEESLVDPDVDLRTLVPGEA
jgi:3-phenylpropionate/trans-cinnamate dioxygenase ferredoxin reductase component